MRTPWGLWALGVFLAGLFYIGAYDNSGREGPCFGDFQGQHPEAFDFLDESRGIEQTCSAIAWDGRVIAVKHYPGKWDWLAVAVALVAPVSIRAIWRRFRWRGLGLAFAAVVAVAFAIAEIEEQPEPLGRSLGSVQHGQRIGTLTFPKFHKTVTVRAGFDQADIDRGPSWFLRGSLPGMGGTTYVAGHRRTHGGPFREIGDLERGDRVIFSLPHARATYTVTKHALVSERDTSVLFTGRNELRLQSSTIPPGHRRLIVFAQLETLERR